MKKVLLFTFVLFAFVCQNAYSQNNWFFTFDSYINEKKELVNSPATIEIRKYAEGAPDLIITYGDQKHIIKVDNAYIHHPKMADYQTTDMNFTGTSMSSGTGSPLNIELNIEFFTGLSEFAARYDKNLIIHVWLNKKTNPIPNTIYFIQSDKYLDDNQFFENGQKFAKWVEKIKHKKINKTKNDKQIVF